MGLLRKLYAMAKALLVAIIAGGVLIASFYTAYALLAFLVLAVVGGIAYLYFRWGSKVDRFDYLDEA